MIPLSIALDDKRVTVMVYVFDVTPSWAVTIAVMVLLPNVKGMLADAVPDFTIVPLIFKVAVGSAVVAVTVVDTVALPTVEV